MKITFIGPEGKWIDQILSSLPDSGRKVLAEHLQSVDQFLSRSGKITPDALFIAADGAEDTTHQIARIRDEVDHLSIFLWQEETDGQTARRCLKSGATDFFGPDSLDRLPVVFPVHLERAQKIVSGRKREQQLLERVEFFGKLVEILPAGVFVSQNGKFVFMNPAGARILGFSSPEEATGREISLTFLPGNHAAIEEKIRHLLQSKSPIPAFETTIRRVDGGLVHVEIKGAFALFNGQPAVLLAIRDIGDRKRAETKLQEEQRLFRMFMANIPDAIYFKDRDGRFLRVNAAQARRLGLDSPEQAEGKSDFDFLPEEEARRNLEEERKVMETGEMLSAEREKIMPSGERCWIRTIKVPLRDERGEVIGIFGITRDITAEKRAQLEIRKLFQAVEQSPLSVVITNRNGDIEYVNPTFTQITGYAQEEVLGKNPRILKSGKHPPEFYRNLWETITSGSIWHGEFVNRKKNGELYHEQATIGPVRDSSGEITHFIGLKLDITDRKKLEEQLFQMQRVEALGRLAGGIAHDFNNLLTVINGYVDIMLRELREGERFFEELVEVRDAGRRAASLTRQLLAFGRKQILKPKSLNLNLLIQDLSRMLRRLIGEDVELVTRLAPDLLPVKVDPAQLEQVIINLAINARDAMPNGGRLVIQTENVHVDGEFAAFGGDSPTGDYVLMTVSDTGTGMDEETRSHIFEPFFTTKEPGVGTGLGLSTVYGIVKQSGGYIWVDSEPGRGTTFKIYLPVLESPESGGLEQKTEPGALRGEEVVLVVEDSESVRSIVCRMLGRCGYRPRAVSSPEEALKLVESLDTPPDLLLTDVIMPGMSGRELVQKLKQHWPRLRVIFMSGYPQEAVSKQGVLEPGLAFIQKPFTPQVLLQKIREVLDSREEGGPLQSVPQDRDAL
ncbi:MAG TPA: PAS domain-containing sensor histidine kinase [Bacteroidetes bacterium]|nr:PAS domain-containing sensor histidine kinase [Bacteroidota bacterium]